MVTTLIKVSVVITTLNEEQNLARCLGALKDFDDIIIFDSGSTDKTVEIAREYGARVESFEWNGRYPKKRQYFLDHVQTKYDYIFFVDADEQVTPELIHEIKALDLSCAGYFVKGAYHWRGKDLKHGLKNNKLALFDRRQIEFPVVDDLGAFCMGEMEGHYQPVLKPTYKDERIGVLHHPLVHFAHDDQAGWERRHQRYAMWEAGMIANGTYPREDNVWRERLKYIFRHMPARGLIAFVHSYLVKRGFMDGVAGFEFARSRQRYYNMVANALRASKASGR